MPCANRWVRLLSFVNSNPQRNATEWSDHTPDLCLAVYRTPDQSSGHKRRFDEGPARSRRVMK
jgi:hypothetical protein